MEREMAMKQISGSAKTRFFFTNKEWLGFVGFLFVMLLAATTGATDFVSIRSGQWFDSATWLPAGYPLNGDNVTIAGNDNVTLSFSNSLNLQINNLVLTNGIVSISGSTNQGTFAISGSGSVWTNGTLSGPLAQLGTLTLLGKNGLNTGSSLTNQGTIHEMGAGDLHPFESTIVNLPGATYDFAGDGVIENGLTADLESFINEGRLLKSSGVNTSSISIDIVNNNGTIEVDSGTLTLANAGSVPASTNGTFIVAQGATLNLAGPPPWTGEITGSGAGQVVLPSGVLNAYPTLTLDFPDGMFQWTGGNMGGTVTNLGVITLSGTNKMGCPNLLVNAGVIRQTNTANLVVSGPTIMNLAGATYDLEGDGDFVNGFYGGNIYNRGLFRKSGGTGVSSFGASYYYNYGGTLEVDSGTLNAAAYFIQTNGTTWLNGGNLTGGTLNFNGGTLTGDGTVTGAVGNYFATVTPGNGLGTLNIAGSYLQGDGAALDIELGGTNAGQFDQLDVSGNATLGGKLSVSLANNFTPAVGERFQILSCSGLSGKFVLTNMPAGLSLTYSNSGVFLTVTGTVYWPVQIISPEVAGQNIDFSFQTLNNQSYTIQSNDNLATTNWVYFAHFTGNGTVIQFVIPMAGVPHRFFRVREP
jgi:hypothetical protein